jgi:hypothetical protein
LRDRGEPAPGLNQPELFEMYSGCAIVPEQENGLDATHDLARGRAQLVEVPAS